MKFINLECVKTRILKGGYKKFFTSYFEIKNSPPFPKQGEYIMIDKYIINNIDEVIKANGGLKSVIGFQQYINTQKYTRNDCLIGLITYHLQTPLVFIILNKDKEITINKLGFKYVKSKDIYSRKYRNVYHNLVFIPMGVIDNDLERISN